MAGEPGMVTAVMMVDTTGKAQIVFFHLIGQALLECLSVHRSVQQLVARIRDGRNRHADDNTKPATPNDPGKLSVVVSWTAALPKK